MLREHRFRAGSRAVARVTRAQRLTVDSDSDRTIFPVAVCKAQPGPKWHLLTHDAAATVKMVLC